MTCKTVHFRCFISSLTFISHRCIFVSYCVPQCVHVEVLGQENFLREDDSVAWWGEIFTLSVRKRCFMRRNTFNDAKNFNAMKFLPLCRGDITCVVLTSTWPKTAGWSLFTPIAVLARRSFCRCCLTTDLTCWSLIITDRSFPCALSHVWSQLPVITLSLWWQLNWLKYFSQNETFYNWKLI